MFSDRPEKQKLVEDVEYFLSVSFVEFRSRDADERSNVSQSIGGPEQPSLFSDWPE